jgi:hypothetical protein
MEGRDQCLQRGETDSQSVLIAQHLFMAAFILSAQPGDPLGVDVSKV